MFRDAKRALYVFSCGLMGSLLLLVLQKTIVLTYTILWLSRPGWDFGLSMIEVQALDVLTSFVALFGGGWYGVWLGIHWYDVVYEQKTFPGLRSHLLEVFSVKNLRIPRGQKSNKKQQDFASFWEFDDIQVGPVTETQTAPLVRIKPKTVRTSAPAVKRITKTPRTAVKKTATRTTHRLTKKATV